MHARKHTHTYTVHMALMGYFIVFSFVTKPGQTLEFLLWGTIVPLNFLAGYYCSIVASTPQPTVYTQSFITIPSEDLFCFFFCCLTQDNPIDFVHEWRPRTAENKEPTREDLLSL